MKGEIFTADVDVTRQAAEPVHLAGNRKSKANGSNGQADDNERFAKVHR